MYLLRGRRWLAWCLREQLTCSGKLVSCKSWSFSAYTSTVFSARRSASSLNVADVPTSDDSDIVTCIFTRLKF